MTDTSSAVQPTPIERSDAFIASLGVEAYRVGGSVRDEILGRASKDADYMARGVSLERLGGILRTAGKGRVVKPIKLRDGVQVGWRINGLEIVLPRREVSTGPGRRDFAIEVDPAITLDEDALRRDFTFNALYRQVGTNAMVGAFPPVPINQVYDPTGHGIYDLQHKTVRITHPDSFRDDPLRILRALRFVSVLGHDLDPETRAMMALQADAVTGLSASGHVSGTVFEEMSKILMGDDVAKALGLARDTGVLAQLFPELAPMIGYEQGSKYHDLTTDEHTFKALDTAAKVDASLRVRWSLLFHDAGKPEAAWIDGDGQRHYYSAKVTELISSPMELGTAEFRERITEDHEVVGERIWRAAANRIGTSAALREDVAKLIRNHMLSLDKPKRNKVRKLRVAFGDDFLRDLILHRACDCSGKGKPDPKQFASLRELAELHQEAIQLKVPRTPQELDITGHDLIALGATGAGIGAIQNTLLLDVICEHVENEREQLIARAARLV